MAKTVAAIGGSASGWETPVKDTRENFVSAAKVLFAKRGFYGVSIAAIAEELGLTKQALLHHFGSKEKLYGEVLGQISSDLERLLDRASQHTFDETMQQIEMGFVNDPDAAAIIMRELLDNEPRAAQSKVWYLRTFLDRLCDLAERDHEFTGMTRTEVFAKVYARAGAANYLAVSMATLDAMYGAGFHADLIKTSVSNPV